MSVLQNAKKFIEFQAHITIQLDCSSLKAVVLCSPRLYKIAASILFKTLYLESEVEFPYDQLPWKNCTHPTHLCVHVKNIVVVRSRGVSPCQFDFCNEFMEFLSYLFRVAENLQNLQYVDFYFILTQC